MRPSQQGFTLIELMIVVAIVGILSSVAIPAYSDYTVRAEVTEAIAAAGAAKTSVADYYYANDALPTSNSEAGLGAGTSYATDVIGEITVGSEGGENLDPGEIQVKFKDFGGSVSVGDTILFIPETTNSSIGWNCSVTDTNATLPAEYAPANCRQPGA